MEKLPTCILEFINYFENISSAPISQLDEIYAEKVIFKDPIRELNGRLEVKAHFEKLNANLGMGRFYFLEQDILPNKAYLRWIMDVRIKKPKSRIRLEGISVLYYDEKITQQKDFFDLGAMVYENVPILGRMIKGIKNKM